MPHLLLSSSLARSEVSSLNDHIAREMTWSETGLWEMLGVLGPVALGRTGASSTGNTCYFTPASCYWEGTRDQRVLRESVNIKYYIKISWFYMLTTNSYFWNSVSDKWKLLWSDRVLSSISDLFQKQPLCAFRPLWPPTSPLLPLAPLC